MSGASVENIMISAEPIVIAGAGSTVVSQEASLSDGGAMDGFRVDIVTSDVVVDSSIVFKIQECSGTDKTGAAHWSDVGAPLTSAISDTASGVFTRQIRSTVSSQAALFPIGKRIRVVVVTVGASSAVTVLAVRLFQPAM